MNLIKIKKIFNITTKEELLPTEEDIKESKDLSDILKDSSEEKTFINIIKFQENEIPYWNERKVIDDVNSLPFITLIFIASVISVVIVIFILGNTNININIINKIAAAIILSAIMSGLVICALFLIKMGIIAVTIDRFRKNGFNFRSGLFYIIDYIQYIREINKYLSSVALPVNKILEWKLAVCRDYSRLTTSLLYNLYPNSEIYIIRITNHQASGIKFNGKIHIFDPDFSLPTNTTFVLNDWLKIKKLEYAISSEEKIKNFIILTYTKSRFGINLEKYWRRKKTFKIGN